MMAFHPLGLCFMREKMTYASISLVEVATYDPAIFAPHGPCVLFTVSCFLIAVGVVDSRFAVVGWGE